MSRKAESGILRGRPRTASLFVTLLALLFAAQTFAGGPLILYDPSTRTPFAYGPGPIPVFTDLGDLGVLPGTQADTLTARGMEAWSGVPTATFLAEVAGDFASIGLPDIDGDNADLVINAVNGPGIHVIYDHDGSVISKFFGAPPGVLGIASPDFATDEVITESWAVLNGLAVDPEDLQPYAGASFAGVFTHEFGHAINLAHSQTNGAVLFFGNAPGPSGCVPPYGGRPTFADQETMYPFIDPAANSVGVEMATVEALDDVASLSNLYPTSAWLDSSASITGTIYLSDGLSQVTGVNVIARNVADPWGDCISGLSGDFTQGLTGPDGRYTFNGLTPGADYVVYVDAIVAGGFSTRPALPLPGREEYYNAENESKDTDIDDPCEAALITPHSGTTQTADIIFNFEILLPDDGSREIPLPFAFPFCDTSYTTVFVGSNGYLTFGGGRNDFEESVIGLLTWRPRIAMLWDDLNPLIGGVVSAEPEGDAFVISYENVPEFLTQNRNTFSISLKPDGSYTLTYGDLDARDGLVGRSPGRGTPDPGETDLDDAPEPIGIAQGSVYELFSANDNDLSGTTLAFAPCADDSLTGPIALPLGDDAFALVPLPFDYPFCDSVYTQVLISSNGYVTFANSDVEFVPSVAKLLEGPPRIAGLWSDLAPNEGGRISFEYGEDRFSAIWEDVPEFLSGNRNTFRIDLFPDGSHQVLYKTLDAVSGVAGRTPGRGVTDPGPTDLSQAGQPLSGPTVYEVFNGTVDLANLSVLFAGCAGDSIGDPPPDPGGQTPPLVVRVGAAWPNPFAGVTRVQLDLPGAGFVRAEVFDARGRLVRSLVQAEWPAGSHILEWDGRTGLEGSAAAGLYFLRITAAGSTQVRKVIRRP